MHSLYFSIASIFVSLLLAAVISNVALGPLKKISRNLDSVSLERARSFPVTNRSTMNSVWSR